MYISFESAINDYLIYLNHKLKCTTYEINNRKIKLYILSYFKNKNIFDLTTKDYLNWQLYIDDFNFKYHYKSSIHYCFTCFLDYCMIFYNLPSNVARKVGNFRNDEVNLFGNIWTLEEFNSFISVVDSKVYNVLFRLLFFTGLRKGEALALTWNDINFDNKTILINKSITRLYKNGERIVTSPKTRQSIRIISIDDNLFNDIVELYDYYKNDNVNFNLNYYVFGGSSSISFTTLERNKNKYCDKAKVKQIKIHEFRHSHACLLFQNNIPIEDISYRLGHSTLSITMDTYLRYLPRDEKRVVTTLNSLN